MATNILFLLFVCALPAAIGWIIWLDIKRSSPTYSANDANGTTSPGVSPSTVAVTLNENPGATSFGSAPPIDPFWLNTNQRFLHGVRSRSCYPMLRIVHAIITTLSAIGCVVLWIVFMNNAILTVDRVEITGVMGLILAAVFIEYGVFRMIVDAVDVLIDTSRRNAGDEAGTDQ